MPAPALETQFAGIFSTIDVSSFTTAQQAQIYAALENLFVNSATAREVIRKIPDVNGDDPYAFVNTPGQWRGTVSETPDRMLLDLSLVGDLRIIDNTGTVTQMSLERALVSQLLPTVEQLLDAPELLASPLDLSGRFAAANVIMAEMGETSLQVSNGALVVGQLTLGAEMTFGAPIDTAYVFGDRDVDATGAEAVPGKERDLLISRGDHANDFKTGDGADFVYAGAGDDTVDAGAGDDAVFGQEGHDSILGGDGTDVLSGDEVVDPMDGSTFGVDTLVGGVGDDILVSTDGLDVAQYTGKGKHFDIVYHADHGTWTVEDLSRNAGDEGYDTLIGITKLEFGAGWTYALSNSATSYTIEIERSEAGATWTKATYVHDLDGTLKSSEFVQASGTTRTLVYDDGVLTGDYESDPDGLRPWTSRSREFDTEGNLERVTRLNDNGIYVEETYQSDGTHTVSKVDFDEAVPWDTHLQYFDASGQLTRTYVTYNDKDTLLIDYVGGKKVQMQRHDVSDEQGWDVLTVKYNSDEVREKVTLDYDNLDTREVTYGPDGPTQITGTDGSDSFEWAERTIDYTYVPEDGSGALTRQISGSKTTFDSGTIATSRYWEGYVEYIDYVDGGGIYDWSTRRDSFQINGDIWSSYRERDDGDQEWIYYEGGVKDRRTIVDTNNSEDWHSRTEVFDSLGNVTAIEFDNFIIIE